jgi:hypothetical protein
MPRGGAREGSGRKKGSLNKRSAIIAAVAEKIAAGEEGETPLEVMMETMRWLRNQAVATEKSKAGVMLDEAGDGSTPIKVYTPLQLRMMAADVASKAAPFVHPKLSNIEANVKGKLEHYEQSLLELDGAAKP